MRKYAIVAASILLLAAAAVLVVVVVTGGLPPDPAAGLSPTATAEAVPDASAPAAPPPIPSPPAAALPPQANADLSRIGMNAGPAYGELAPKPPKGSWEAVAPVARPAALGPVGAAVGRELAELQPRLAACFDEVVQARHGRIPLTEVKDYAPTEDSGTTILMLQVETLQGEVRIVDAPLETRGGASDGLIACAQRVLRGHTFGVPGATPGVRHRVLYTLTQ